MYSKAGGGDVDRFCSNNVHVCSGQHIAGLMNGEVKDDIKVLDPPMLT